MFDLNTRHRRDRAARTRPEAGADEIGDGASFRITGFTAGTRVASANGWSPIKDISVGDRVMTFDNGMQPVVAVTRGTHVAADDLPEFAVPIHVPIAAVGNEEPMVLLPEQIVMLESDTAEALTGDPFALVPAKALEGYRGIDRIHGLRPVEVVSLHFENDEVIFADGGALLLASSAVPGIVPLDALEALGGLPAPYQVYRGPYARALVAAIAAEDARNFTKAQDTRAA